MALTDQPYLPLYVDDWMNNNKLKICSPQAHGLLISIMCIMHKENPYGKILLKQKFKQTGKQIESFASQIAKQSSFDLVDILPALKELLEEKVIDINGDWLISSRMVNDAELSAKRAIVGSKGGSKTQKLASSFAKPKEEPNAVNGIDIVIVNKEDTNNENLEEKTPIEILFEMWVKANRDYQTVINLDYSALREMFEFFTDSDISKCPIESLIEKMNLFIQVVANDKFLKDKPLSTIKSQMQRVKTKLIPQKTKMIW